MKIVSVRSTAVRMPVPRAPYPSDGAGTKFHWGKRSRVTPARPSPMLEYVLVTIESDEGLVGVGEASADIGFFGNTVEAVKVAIDDYLGPQLVGLDPCDREHLMSVIDFRGQTCAKAGIDLALHDLVAKELGAPVSVLLGGRQKKCVPVSVEIPGGSPDAMAAECVRYMETGVRAFKAKIGGDPVDDAERLRTIREAVGADVSLRADANQGYTPKEAIRLCRLAERHDVRLELLEQPVAAWDLNGMAQVREAVDVLIEADEACYTPHDVVRIAENRAADVVNIKIGKAGGLLNAKKIAAVAEAAGLGCVLGTSFGLGIEIAAKLHLAASTPTATGAVEFTELGLHENLLQSPGRELLALPLKDGQLPVPDGPGFGVALDEERLQAYTLALRSTG